MKKRMTLCSLLAILLGYSCTNPAAGYPVSHPPAANATRSVTIDMFDSGNNGWGGYGALRITINGFDIASTIKVHAAAADNTPAAQKSFNTYTFNVVTGDVVQVYWVAGALQRENSFIVYYADMPPLPAFDADSNGAWNGANALIYKTHGSMNTLPGGTLLGSFTVLNT